MKAIHQLVTWSGTSDPDCRFRCKQSLTSSVCPNLTYSAAKQCTSLERLQGGWRSDFPVQDNVDGRVFEVRVCVSAWEWQCTCECAWVYENGMCVWFRIWVRKGKYTYVRVWVRICLRVCLRVWEFKDAQPSRQSAPFHSSSHTLLHKIG